MRVLAIDQGTSATKALVIDDGGVVLGRAEVAVRVDSGADGAVECDPEDLWQSVLTAGRAAVAAASAPIDAVGLANQGETVLAWSRRDGRPRSRAIVWQDRRSAELCRALAPHGPELAARSGLELDPYFAAPKMAWLRARTPAEAGVVITTTDTWLLHRLCGAFATDAATASRTLLLDLDTVTWHDDSCAVFGLTTNELPAVVDNDAVLGTTTAFGATPVPVSGTCVDQQAALFAERCWAAGEAKCTYGTGAFLLTSTGARPTRSANGLVGSVAWRLGGTPAWCLDGQVYTVGAAVSWLEQTGLIAGPADLDGVGGTVASAGGVEFVPGLAGLGAPFWKPDARGAFTGLSLATTRAHLVRAVIDGIAAQVAWLAQAAAADLGRPVGTMRVDGGLTRSRTLLQAQADLLQAPVEVYPSPDATALGVGAMARLGAGGSATAAEAVGPAGVSAVVEPRMSADEATARLASWRAAADATMGLS